MPLPNTSSSKGHGYGMRPGNPAAETWTSLAEKWLASTLETIEPFRADITDALKAGKNISEKPKN